MRWSVSLKCKFTGIVFQLPLGIVYLFHWRRFVFLLDLKRKLNIRLSILGENIYEIRGLCHSSSTAQSRSSQTEERLIGIFLYRIFMTSDENTFLRNEAGFNIILFEVTVALWNMNFLVFSKYFPQPHPTPIIREGHYLADTTFQVLSFSKVGPTAGGLERKFPSGQWPSPGAISTNSAISGSCSNVSMTPAGHSSTSFHPSSLWSVILLSFASSVLAVLLLLQHY